MIERDKITPITLRESIAEITIICKEWDNVEFRNNQLSVRINNVELSDDNETIKLGDFGIHLDLTNGDLAIESIDKIASEAGYYHPHIENDKLCTGDGEDLINDAIRQGRLEDYFRLVEAILRTYNGNSAYKQLCDWYAPSHDNEFYCDYCGEWRDNDEDVWCSSCDTQYCDHCADGGCCVDCSKWVCSECGTVCDDCNETICGQCAKKCNSCGNYFCESCIHSCSNCHETVCGDCKTTCGYCECECCEQCQANCVDCGVIMCKSCEDEHNCLLKEVENGTT